MLDAARTVAGAAVRKNTIDVKTASLPERIREQARVMFEETSESRLRALIARLVRYDLVTHYRCGDAVEEMAPSEGGDYVRFDELEAVLGDFDEDEDPDFEPDEYHPGWCPYSGEPEDICPCSDCMNRRAERSDQTPESR
jgi:hypothetical protein